MSIGIVSFGKVVDISYKYSKRDSEGYNKANNLFKSASYVPLNKSMHREDYNIRSVLCSEYDKRFYNRVTRIITDDDLNIYNYLRKAFGDYEAKKYADRHVENLIIDV